MQKAQYTVNPVEIKLKEYIDGLTVENWESLHDSLILYYKLGVFSLIPMSNFRFLVEFGLLESDHKAKLKEILEILEYKF